jgi:hypothetical protein
MRNKKLEHYYHRREETPQAHAMWCDKCAKLTVHFLRTSAVIDFQTMYLYQCRVCGHYRIW